MKRQKFREFSDTEHDTWRQMFSRQAEKREEQIHPMFSDGIRALAIGPDRVPDIDEVNRRLREKTGFEGVPVEGFEEAESFYEMLAERRFPIGNFIRDPGDLNYTPAPDVFHDLYGHLPFLVDERYADFCQRLGAATIRHRARPEAVREFERLFWFTIEFGLIETPRGRRVFGAGIASSVGETRYALSAEPSVEPFDAETVRAREFKIDEFQRGLFLLKSVEQLYDSLEEFERKTRP